MNNESNILSDPHAQDVYNQCVAAGWNPSDCAKFAPTAGDVRNVFTPSPNPSGIDSSNPLATGKYALNNAAKNLQNKIKSLGGATSILTNPDKYDALTGNTPASDLFSGTWGAVKTIFGLSLSRWGFILVGLIMFAGGIWMLGFNVFSPIGKIADKLGGES